MALTMVALPAEILQGISTILDISHPGSLVAFALTNKRCYANATTVLYRTVKITIGSRREQPQFHGLQRLEKRLLRDDAFARVRRLMLCTSPDAYTYPYPLLDSGEKYSEDDTGIVSSWFGCLEACEYRPHEASVAEEEWEPAIRLVQQLTGLRDLIWACPEQFPLRLLQLLEEKSNPRLCRLHHYTLSLGSSTELPLTSYQSALLASPCLFSVGSLDPQLDGRGLKTLRNVHSPSLRRAYLSLNLDGNNRNSTSCAEAPLGPPEALHVEAHHLSPPIPFSMVRRESFGDLTTLRVLVLEAVLAPEGFPAPGDLPSLVSLSFKCATDDGIPAEYWDKVTTLLRSLQHLSALEVWDWNPQMPIIPCLGPNLRTLYVDTLSSPGRAGLSDDNIHKLADTCPNLERLDIDVRRSRGDAAEVARYRSLGRLARLQELNLCLDASPPCCIETDFGSDTAVEAWFDQQDVRYLPRRLWPYREGHVRDALLNSAIDEELALSIFQVIDGAKQGAPGHARPLPLERLTIRIVRGADFPTDARSRSALMNLKRLLYAFQFQWIIQRGIRDDSREVLRVSQSGWNRHEQDKPSPGFAKYNAYWFGFWQRTWPVEDDSVNWWEDWESLPLALEVDASNNTS